MSRLHCLRPLVVGSVTLLAGVRAAGDAALPATGLGPIAVGAGVVLIVTGTAVFTLGSIAAHGAQRAGRRVGPRR